MVGFQGQPGGSANMRGRLQAPKTLGYQRAANHRVASDHLEKSLDATKNPHPWFAGRTIRPPGIEERPTFTTPFQYAV